MELWIYIIMVVMLCLLMSLGSNQLCSLDPMLCRLIEGIVVRDSQDRRGGKGFDGLQDSPGVREENNPSGVATDMGLDFSPTPEMIAGPTGPLRKSRG
jgi:hypothetical protein